MSNMNKVAKELKKAMTESDERKPKAYDTEATVTHVDGNTLWVKFPGGETETPVRRTIDAKPGDVVMVRVANHRAWTGGNSTNPPTDDTRANQIGEAAQPSIDFVAELRDKDVTVKSITAATGYIDDLYSKNIHTENIWAATGYIDELYSKNITTDNLEATTAYIKDLTAEEIEAGAITTKTLDAKYATINELHADYAHIKDGVIDNAKIGYADVQDLHAHYAALDFANVLTADIQEAWIKDLMVQGQMVAQDGTIYRLTGLHLNANDIDVGQLKADRLLLLGDDGLYYSINVNTLGESYIEQCTEEEQLEFRRTIHADVITANSITVDKITTNNLIGTGGWINLRSGTFAYENASTGDGISWDGQHLSLRGDVEITSNNYYTKTDVDGLIGDIQDQVDGVVDTWYYAVDPTTSNAPASSWTTDNDRYNHLRDLYFNTTNGHSFRWAIERTNDASVVSGKRYYIRNSATGKYEYVPNPTTSGLAQYFEYQWIEIKDADAIKALSDAAKAQDTADGKRRVFTAQPTNAQAYDVGDLWVNATYGTTYNNDILKCKTKKAAGAAFNISHWGLASKYTDDSNVYKKSDFSITPEAIIGKVTAIEGWEIGGRNLLIGTKESKELTTKANQSWFTPIIYKLSAFANTAIADTNKTDVTFSFDYVITGVDTAFDMIVSLRTASGSFGAVVKVAEIPVGNSSGHAVGTRTITDAMREFAPNSGVLLSGSGNANANAKVTVSNFKVEFGNKQTDWTPAPEDTDESISSLETEISEQAEAISLRATKAEVFANYGTCSTAAATAAKVVELDGFALNKGAQISVRFDNGNTAASPTLNVNGTGAKAILIDGGTRPTADKFKLSGYSTANFTYDGTYWRYTGGSYESAQLVVQAGQISSKVEKNGVISAIRQTPETVKIQASKIEFEGTSQFVKDVQNSIQVGGVNLFRNSYLYGAFTKDGLTFSDVSGHPERMHIEGTPTQNGNVTIASLSSISVTNCTVTISTNAVFNGSSRFAVSTTKDGAWYREAGAIQYYSNTERRLTITLENGETLRYLYLYYYKDEAINNSFRFKIEIGNKQTQWSPAPEDVQDDIDAKRSTFTVNATGSDASQSYATIVAWAAEGRQLTFAVDSTAGIKAGDTVRIKTVANNMGPSPGTPVYVVTTCRETPTSATSIKTTSHGLDTTVIDGGHILTGTIDAARIGANSITAQKLAIGDFNNYITANENDEASLNTGNAGVLSNGWIYKESATGANIWLSPLLPNWTTQGEKYRVTGTVKAPAAGSAVIVIYGRDATGSGVASNSYTTVIPTKNTEVSINGIIEVGSNLANAPKANIAIIFCTTSNWTSNYQAGYCKNMKCERMSGGSLIVDGAIKASHVDSDDITANKFISSATLTNINHGESAYNRATAYRGILGTRTDGAVTVNCTGFSLATGATISVYMGSSNNYNGKLTLNVNSTGAKDVYVGDLVTSDTNRLLWHWGSTITFTYDGTYWRVVDAPGSYYGTACSTAAATANKQTTIPSGVIFKGCVIEVPMSHENTNTAPYLYIQNSASSASNLGGAILYGTGSTVPTQANGYSWLAGMSVIFKYDGKYWRSGNQTIIDGSHILTGTINADRIKATVINAVNNGTGRINADKITVGLGGVNLLKNSKLRKSLIKNGITFGTSSAGPEYVYVSGTATAAFDEYIADLQDIGVSGTTVTISANYIITGSKFYVSTTKNDEIYRNISEITYYSANERRLTIDLESGETLRFLRLAIPNGGTVSGSYRFKVEVGDKQTAWSPAEDAYITDIGNDGIYIHDSLTSSNCIRLTSSGVNIYKGGTADANSLAFYGGDSARIGKLALPHVSITSEGLQVYTGTASDSTHVANFGSTVTIGQSDKSRVYITPENGMRVYDKNNKRRMWLDWDGFYLYDDSEVITSAFTPSSARIGKIANGYSRLVVNDNSIDIIARNSSGTDSTLRIGSENTNIMRIGDPYFSSYLRIEKSDSAPSVDLHTVAVNSAQYTNLALQKDFIQLRGGGGSKTYTALQADFTSSGCTLTSKASSVSIDGSLTLGGTYNKLYKITTLQVGLSNGLAKHTYSSASDYTMTAQSGYNAVGIVGWTTTQWRIRPTTHYIKSNTVLHSGFSNTSEGDATGSQYITFYVLWLKATSG